MGKKTKGIPVARGIAYDDAFVLKDKKIEIKHETVEDIEQELEKFKKATEESYKEIESIKQNVLKSSGKETAKIFDAHLSLLEDPRLTSEIKEKIKEESLSAAYATYIIADKWKDVFKDMDNEYMKERSADIKDVSNRIIRHLEGIEKKELLEISKPVILVAEDLLPSQTAQLDLNLIKGFVTDKGTSTSHTAIIAKTFGIPAVVGTKNITSKVNDNDKILVDSTKGEVFINPDQKKVEQLLKKKEKLQERKKELKKLKDKKAVTLDGREIEVYANIGHPNDVESALENGAEGIGLFRTEFLFLDRSSLPDENEQFKNYKSVLTKMGDKTVIIRTLDIGGDKDLPYLNLPKEENPFLGYRAVRVSLDRTEIFKEQLRALLRASIHGNLHIMVPMITTINEVHQVKALFKEVKTELDEEGIDYDQDIPFGIMVEIPAVAMNAESFIKEVDFFSIGTNDLCQYSLAVDRLNEKVSYLYQPFHPGILRMIKNIIQASHQYNKVTGLCGEFASYPVATILLLGFGLDEFSMTSQNIPEIKDIIRKVKIENAQSIAQKALTMESAEDVKEYLEEELEKIRRAEKDEKFEPQKQKGRIEKAYIVQDPAGLHARPATEMVKEANKYDSEIKIKFKDSVINAKSSLEVMSLGAGEGSKLILIIEGKDQEEAFDKIDKIMQKAI